MTLALTGRRSANRAHSPLRSMSESNRPDVPRDRRVSTTKQTHRPLERVMRLELTTPCLEGRYSSQLSYTRSINTDEAFSELKLHPA